MENPQLESYKVVKNEILSYQIKNKTRMLDFNASMQHNTGSQIVINVPS